MSTCTQNGSSAPACPTRDDLLDMIIALHPPGAAWAGLRGGERWPGVAPEYGTYALGGGGGIGGIAGGDRVPVMRQFWTAFADVLAFLHQRACGLLEEMCCASTVELRAAWGRDFGFPDACEPFENLCAKVRASPGQTCAYFEELAARIGYTVACVDACDPPAVADTAVADIGTAAGITPNRMHVIISAGPGITTPPPFVADLAIADWTPPCVPTPDAVICLIERFKPAHVRATYEVVA